MYKNSKKDTQESMNSRNFWGVELWTTSDWGDWRETFVDYFISCSVLILNMMHVCLLWNKGEGERMEGRKQGSEGRKKSKIRIILLQNNEGVPFSKRLDF